MKPFPPLHVVRAAFALVMLAPFALDGGCAGNPDVPAPAKLDAGNADAPGADAPGADARDAETGAPDCICAGVTSGARLRAIYTTETAADGARARFFEQRFYDAVRNEECEFPYDAPEGPTRCLPVRDYLISQAFTDATCTTAIAVSPAGVCAPAKKPPYLLVGQITACPAVLAKVYPVVAETTPGDTYSLQVQSGGATTCVKNQPLTGARFFTLGAEIDQAQFAAGTKTKNAHPAECACGPIHSGTRLEARVDEIVTADGARAQGYVSNWHDKELDVTCALERYTTLGPGWCVPEREQDVLWSDATCATAPILAHPVTCIPVTKYASVNAAPVQCGGSLPRLFPVGAETTLPATYYQLSYNTAGMAVCTKLSGARSGMWAYYSLGAELPSSKLATYATTFEQATAGAPSAGETQECACGDAVSGPRLLSVYQMSRGADGMRQREFSDWFDVLRKEECHRIYDGEIRPENHCVPSSLITNGNAYSDATCALRVPFTYPTPCGPTAPPKYLASDTLTPECTSRLESRVYALGAETTAATSWYTGTATANAVTCTATSGPFPVAGAKFYALGAEVSKADLVVLTSKTAHE